MSGRFSDQLVLVTGVAGFVGSHLADTLLSEGAFVVGIDNFISGRSVNISHLSDNRRFSFLQQDVSQPSSMYTEPLAQLIAHMSGPTAISHLFHFASPASPPHYQKHPIATYRVNSFGTHHLLEFIHEHHPSARFIYASTSEVYGDPAVHPQVESYWGNVNPNGPRSCYDESKRLGETIVGVFVSEFQIDIRIVRIFNTYGPRINPDDGRIIPNFIKQGLQNQPLTIYGDGSQTRSFCYVSDLVEGIVRLATVDAARGITINLGNPVERTALDTAEIIKAATHNKHEVSFYPLPVDDPTRRCPDISLAKQILNWEPQISFEDGLALTVAHFRTSERLTSDRPVG